MQRWFSMPVIEDEREWLRRSWDQASPSAAKDATLVIAFGGLAGRLGGPREEGQGQGLPPHEFVRACHGAGVTHSIFVRDLRQAWYLTGTPEQPRGGFDAVVAALRLEIEAVAPARVVTLGASMGGYAAIRAGLALGVDKIVAFSPQVLVDSTARAEAALPTMPFDDHLCRLKRALWLEGVPMTSLTECVDAAAATATATTVSRATACHMEVHVGEKEPGDVREARMLQAAVEALASEEDSGRGGVGLSCRLHLHPGRDHNVATEMRDTGELHGLLRRLCGGSDVPVGPPPAADDAPLATSTPLADIDADTHADTDVEPDARRFWAVEPPPVARETLSLTDLLRLSAAAGGGSGGDADGGGRLWTTRPTLPLLDSAAPAATALPLACHPETVALRGVLEAGECARIIRLLESIPKGFGAGRAVASGPESLRRNEVLVWVAPPPLLATLWGRVAPALAQAGLPTPRGGATGLNARFRCYRYGAGDEFLPHHDGGQRAAVLSDDGRTLSEDSSRACSRWSLLLYLNGTAAANNASADFAGGATLLLPGGDDADAVRVTPETGGGLAFPHGDHPRSLLHAGEAVASGVKYVIRTDVFAM